MVIFMARGNLSETDMDQIAAYWSNRDTEVTVLTGRSELALTLDLTQVTAIAGTVIALIDLYLTLKRNSTEKVQTKAQDLAEIHKRVVGKLKEFNITDFTISQMSGLDALIAGKKGALCRMQVSAAGTHFTILLSRDGNTHILEVA